MAKMKGSDERLRAIPLFRELSNQELQRLSRLMTAVEIPAGHQLITQGDVGREFMIIVEGTAAVRRSGRRVAEVGPGDFLGEVSVLAGTPRNADVVATSDMVVEVLTAGELASLLDENARITRKILVGALVRLAQVERSQIS